MKLSTFVAAAGLCASAAAQDKVKIMYLGDSITEITCWRAIVYDMLIDAGLDDKVEFVGSMNNNPQRCASDGGQFVVTHEGHSGWQAYNIANQYLPGWLDDSQPDIVQFMLGTNDVSAQRTTDTIIGSFDKMLVQMRASNPNMGVIVDKLVNLNFNNAAVQAINARIDAWAETNNSTESPILVADCSEKAGYTNAMNRDGVHPGPQGDALMAKQIGPLLINLINAKLSGV